MSAVITPFEGTELFNTASFNNRISQINTGFSYISNPNLLDNWYFGNPVNQRGQTEYVVSAKSNAYTIDRWQMFYYAGSVSLENDGITISANAGTNVAFIQKHENGLPDQYANFAYRGMKATLSALASDGTLGSKTFTFPETYQDNTRVVSFDILSEISIQIFFHNTAGVMTRIYVNKGKSVTIKGIKLELGSQQTLAHQDENGNWVLNEIPDYGEQLRRCQRYYRRWTGADNKPLGVAVRRESKVLELVFSLDTAMRVAPSLTFNGSFVCVPTFTWCSVTSIDIATPDTVSIFLKPNDDVTFGLDAYQINIANANEYIALSADL